MIVIGSQALLFRLEQTEEVINRRIKADYDVIMSLEEFTSWSRDNEKYIRSIRPTGASKYKAVINVDGLRKVYEIELGLEGTSSKFLLDNKDEVTDDYYIHGIFGEHFNTLNLEYQLATKRSHLIYPVHFEKNIDDYHLLKGITGITGELYMGKKMKEYYNLRSEEAKNRYKQKTPNLNVTTEDFFSSKLPVPNYFVHDHIHEVMAHNERPVYTMMQKDPNKAWCEKDMFFNLPYEYQVQCVQEEAYVIALERYIIPQYGDDWNDYFICYKKAVKRICTTLTSGWFREFAIENYDKVIENYNPSFVSVFYNAVEDGRVEPILKNVPKMVV